jgi:hypothetical protein
MKTVFAGILVLFVTLPLGSQPALGGNYSISTNAPGTNHIRGMFRNLGSALGANPTNTAATNQAGALLQNLNGTLGNQVSTNAAAATNQPSQVLQNLNGALGNQVSTNVVAATNRTSQALQNLGGILNAGNVVTNQAVTNQGPVRNVLKGLFH